MQTKKAVLSALADGTAFGRQPFAPEPSNPPDDIPEPSLHKNVTTL
jgi:hypothetical protein